MPPKPNLLQKANTAASGAIRDKAAVRSDLMSGLLPDIRARAICVAGIDDSKGAVGRIREALAKVPEGADWKKTRREIQDEVRREWYDPAKHGEPEAWMKLHEAAEGKAEALLRTHVFQAYSASRYREQQEFKADFPYLIYITMGDGNVRESHQALDGKILPADDPFWDTHYPPWDWGCRCIVQSLTAEDARERGVTTHGEIERYEHKFPGDDSDFEFHPGSLAIPLKDLRGSLTDEEWVMFAKRMTEQHVVLPDGNRASVWEWLEFDGDPIAENGTVKYKPFTTMENAKNFASAAVGEKFDAWGGEPSLKALNNANEAFRRALVRNGLEPAEVFGTYKGHAVAGANEHGFWFGEKDFANPEAAYRRDVSDYQAENNGHCWSVAPSAELYAEASAEHEVIHYMLKNSPKYSELSKRLEAEFEKANADKSIFKISDYAAEDPEEMFSEIGVRYRYKMPMPQKFKNLFEEIMNEIRN